MPAISLGLGEVEERLQQIRRRLNSLSLQHVAYLSGTLVVLLGAVLVVVALRAPPALLRLCLTGYAVVVCAIGGTAAVRLRASWLSLEGVARLADREAALDSRLSTLYAQRSRPQRSRLGGILLAQTLALGPRWDRSALAPRRVSRSIYLLLFSWMVLGASWFLTSGQVESPVADDNSLAAAKDESPTLDTESVASNALPMPAAEKRGAGGEGTGGGLVRQGGSPGQAPDRSDFQSFTGSPEARELGEGKSGGLAGADAGPEDKAGGAAPDVGEDGPEVQHAGINLQERRQGSPDRRPSSERRFAAEEEAAQSGQHAKRDPYPREANGGANARSEPQRESSSSKGGSKPAGKLGSQTSDPLYESGEAPIARSGEAGKPGTFALRLSGVSASAPADVEPQNKKPPEGVQGFGLGQASSSQTRFAEHQVEDEPLQKALISPEHESVLRRIFQRD